MPALTRSAGNAQVFEDTVVSHRGGQRERLPNFRRSAFSGPSIFTTGLVALSSDLLEPAPKCAVSDMMSMSSISIESRRSRQPETAFCDFEPCEVRSDQLLVLEVRHLCRKMNRLRRGRKCVGC